MPGKISSSPTLIPEALEDAQVEEVILTYFRERRGQEVPRFKAVHDIADQLKLRVPTLKSNHADKIALVISRRLIQARKIVRNRKARTLRLHERMP
jgi:hypothetical protein